jgi:hypothetical protein
MACDARAVPCNIFSWPAIASLLPEQKLIFSYLWFSRFSNTCGCFQISTAPAAAELSLHPSALEDALAEFQRRGLVERDEQTGEIFVTAWFRFNKFPPGPRQRVLISEFSKIESPRLKNLVRKNIENTVGCVLPIEESIAYAPRGEEKCDCAGEKSISTNSDNYKTANEESTTYIPRVGKEKKNPTPLPPTEVSSPSLSPNPRAGGGDVEEIEKLIAATLRARQADDPPKHPAAWTAWARRQAANGDLTPLAPGQRLLEEENRQRQTQMRLEAARAAPPPLDPAVMAVGAEKILRIRQQRAAQQQAIGAQSS